MAIVNPSSLYSGGGAVVNTQPHTNFLIQALAKKQAQQDALDQYYRQIQTRLSGEELRPQDTEGFQSKFNDFQDYYIRNKKAILNGDIGANNEYEQRYRDLISDTQKSKAAAKQELLAAQHHFSGKWQPTSDDMNLLGKMGASIYDPSHYKDDTGTNPVTVNDLSIYVPDLDEKKYLQTLQEGQKPSELPVGQPQKIGNFMMRQYSESGYTPQQIKGFGDRVLSGVDANPSVKKLASQKYDYIDTNPDLKESLNSTFKQVYGRDAQSPAEYYAAEVMSGLGQKSQKYKDFEDRQAYGDYRQKQRIQMAALTDAYAKGRQEFGHALTQADKQTANLWIDDYIDGLANKASEGSPVPYKTAKGDVSQEHIIPLDATLSKALAKDGIQPDQLRVTADGSFRPVWFKRDANGKILEGDNNMAAVDNIRSTPISKDQVKLSLGKTSAGTKQTNIEMSAPKAKHPLPKGQARTRKQGGFTYTWNEETGQYE